MVMDLIYLLDNLTSQHAKDIKLTTIVNHEKSNVILLFKSHHLINKSNDVTSVYFTDQKYVLTYLSHC